MKKTLSLILAAVMIASAVAAFTSSAADASLTLWFDHSFTKVDQNDFTPTGLGTYTVKMAKNEIEDCQFFLASTAALDVSVEVSDFVGPDTITPELFWEYCVKMGDRGTLPDPLIPYVQSVSLKANKSQGFIVKIKTAPDTPAGDYDATVTVRGADGAVLKTAAISLHVWDFALSEKTPVKTLFGMGGYGIYAAHGNPDDGGALYAKYYDFLLENRICSYDLPYGLGDERVDEYLDNERVNSFCIGGQGAKLSDDEIAAAYAKLSQNPEWFDKGIFYVVDEPTSEFGIEKIKEAGEKLESIYPGYKMISPYFVNYEFGGKDMIELMSPYISVWCTKINAWTPQGAAGAGVEHMMSDAQIAKNGTYAERMAAEVAGGDENWDYFCWEPLEPYVTFDASHQGIEQRIAFWQTYDVGATGLLYFAVNEKSSWRDLEKINASGVPVYGDGTMIYYGSRLNQVGQPKTDDPVGSTRIETIRDGIEDYMYLSMAAELYGDDAVAAVIDRVTASVIDWTKDGDVLAAARDELGEMLEEKLGAPKYVPERLELAASSPFSLDGEVKVVRGIAGGVTAGRLAASFEGGKGIGVYSPDGEKLAASDYVYDGCLVRLYHGSVLIDEATVRAAGDADCDGLLNARDVTAIMRRLVGWDDAISESAADVNGDGKINVRDVVAVMAKLVGRNVEFVYPTGASRVWKGETALKLYTDVPEGDASRVCRAVDADSLGETPSINFAVPYGQYVNTITVPVTIADGGFIAVRLRRLDGEGAPEYESNFWFGDADGGAVTLDFTDLIDGHSYLGAGLYSLEIAASSGATVVERNAVIRESGFFPGAAGVDDGRETNFEATVTVEYTDGFDLSKDVNLSTMLRPIETTVAIPGLTREYTFLHVTDTHLTLSYDEELTTAAKRSEQSERNAQFTAVTGVNSADRFPYYMRYAGLIGADRIAATGDIVDYASMKNVDTAFRDNLAVCGVPFTYCFGNHDWSFRSDYCTHSARRRYGDVLFPEYMGGDDYYEQIEYDDFIVISVDNSADRFWQHSDEKGAAERAAEYFERFKAANGLGKPIVLMMHVPFVSPTLVEPTKAAWGGRNILIGPGSDLSGYYGVTEQMYEMISGGESNVALILCGHLHFNHVDMVGDVPQIVTGDGYEGYTRVIRLVPAE